MNVLRIVIGVVAGYLLFAVVSVMLFTVTGRDPHAPAGLAFGALSVAVGMAAAFAGGLVATLVARRRDMQAAVALAVLLGFVALISLGFGLARHESVWTQTAAVLLMAPSALAGGLWRARNSG